MTDVARKPSLSDPSLYINRELSYLNFIERVLAQARDERHPLLERVRFVAICETILDEFFMIRVAGLQQQVVSDLPNPVPDGMTPEEQLLRIREHTEGFF
ncbi:MAG: RNA degradosome polyphosphate kinase, partial [Rubrobacter sp.]